MVTGHRLVENRNRSTFPSHWPARASQSRGSSFSASSCFSGSAGSIRAPRSRTARRSVRRTRSTRGSSPASVRSAVRAPRRTHCRPASRRSASAGGEGPGNYAFCDVDQSQQGVPGQPADAADGSQLVIYGQVHALQVADSRRRTAARRARRELVDSFRPLVANFNPPRRLRRYYVRMRVRGQRFDPPSPADQIPRRLLRADRARDHDGGRAR